MKYKLLAAGLSCGVLVTTSCQEKEAVTPAERSELSEKSAVSEAVVPKAVAKEDTTVQADTVKPTVTLVNAPKEMLFPARFDLTKAIRAHVLEKSGDTQEAEMKPYILQPDHAPDSTYKMIPIKGGTFTMGSPESEVDRSEDEGAQRKITIEPFWMGEVEVTWDLYHKFMENSQDQHSSVLNAQKKALSRNKDGSINKDGNHDTPEKPDVASGLPLDNLTSQPTPPYHVMTFNMGPGYSKDYPAIAMTQQAAVKFCQWLSAKTGEYYRLPTEAEWEYACRAGTKTAYSFGDDASKLGEYAVFSDNAPLGSSGNEEYSPIKQKKPNPWGLYDMHGSVAEWVMDMHSEPYAKLPDGVLNPLQLGTELYGKAVRGGSYLSDAEECRSASRQFSDEEWKIFDPQTPKSWWYFTKATGVGFRVIRPARIPSAEEMHLMWNLGRGEGE